jgi:hypothetical protein
VKTFNRTDYPAPASVRWLVKHLVRAGSTGVQYGPPGSGKSAGATDLACHVDTGKPWRGLKVAGGPVVIVAGEDPEGTMLMVQAWEDHHRTKTRVAVVAGPINLDLDPTTGEPKDLAELTQHLERIAADLGEPIALIILDTLASMWRDESNEGMALFVGHCRDLADRFDCAVLVVHHTGKDASRGERGGSALRAGVDLSLEYSREGDAGCISAVKVRGATDGMRWGYTLAPVTLGEDADGDPITAVVTAPCPPPTKGGRLTPRGTIVLRALLIATELAKANGSADIPEEVLREQAYRLLPDKNNKRRDFRAGRDDAITKGYIRCLDGYFAISPDCVIPPDVRRTVEDVARAVN